MEQGKRYSTIAMALHWIIAVLVIWNWRLAESAEHAEHAGGGGHGAMSPEAAAILADHKAIGITILVLSLARLGWRLAHPVPQLPSTYASWERLLARSTHVIFYVMLIGLPIGGWLATSLEGEVVDVFGLFALPSLPVGQNPALAETIFDAHKLGGKVTIYLIGLHVLGGLKHTFVDKDGGIFRMLPFGNVRG